MSLPATLRRPRPSPALHDAERRDRSLSDKVNLRLDGNLDPAVLLACGIGGGRSDELLRAPFDVVAPTSPHAATIARVARRLRSACSRRAVCLAVPLITRG
jgi:hypothetical protein